MAEKVGEVARGELQRKAQKRRLTIARFLELQKMVKSKKGHKESCTFARQCDEIARWRPMK